jgi:Holliday junction resolvasome RuvABC endonuclease subunit
MILAVDSAMATCGFAVVQRRPVRVLELGVITTERNAEISAITDRARRIAHVTRELRKVRDRHAVSIIAGEQPLGFGSIHAVLPQAMCFAALIALATEVDVDCGEIAAKEWQHAAQPGMAKKIDYAQLKRDLAVYTGPRIDEVPDALQTHALDAIGIGLFVALRPVTLVWRGRARRERDAARAAVHVERTTEGATT